MNFDQCLEALLALATSDRPVTNAQVDDLVDQYLIGFGAQTATERGKLARAFKERAHASTRTTNVWERVLRISV